MQNKESLQHRINPPPGKNSALDRLKKLKQEIRPKDALKAVKENLKEGAAQVANTVKNIKPQEWAVMGGAAALLYLLHEKEEEKPENQSKTDETDKQKPDIANQTTDITSGASKPSKPEEKKSEQVVASIEIKAKNMRDLHARLKKLEKDYNSEKDPAKKQKIKQELNALQNRFRDFIVEAIGIKESGRGRLSWRMRLANTQAIAYEITRPGRDGLYTNNLGQQLKKLGIKPPPAIRKGAASLFGKGLGTLDQFTERVISQLQPYPNMSREKRINNAAEILSRSALGMYQIIGIYHLGPEFRKADGTKKMQIMYEFLKSKDRQDTAVGRIVEWLGAKYEWNPLYISAAYYGGDKAARKLKNNPKAPSLDLKQAHGYGSIKQYTSRFEKLMDECIAKA